MTACKRDQCNGELKITHTFRAGTDGRTQRLVCDCCGAVWKSITVFEEAEGYGNGAAAEAKRLAQKKSP